MLASSVPFIFLVNFLPCSGADKLDEMLPDVLRRLDNVREVLAPLPREVLEEALYHTASYYIPIDSETELCRNHSSILFDSFLNFEVWALKMVDASSKGNPGMLDGNIMDLGNYGQCVSVQAPNNLFKGQHCVVETRGVMPLEMDTLNPQNPILPYLRIDLMFSVCVPSSCSAADVKTHMDVALNSVNATAIIYNSSCSSADPIPYQNQDYVVICILILIALLIALSTWVDSETDKQEKRQMLLCFSLRRNTTQLFNVSADSSLPCLHGLRVLAMAWLMLGYRMLHLLASPNFRFKYLAENIDNLAWAPVENAQLAIEIFFLITGVLVTYSFFLNQQKGSGFSYIKFFCNHYLRLTPSLALVTLLYATLAVHVTEGPVWRRLFIFQQEFCKKHWWSNLLYISNYVNPYEMCIPQTWYLAVEFQMYVLSPVLLLPLYKSSKRGFVFLVVAILATIVGGMVNAYLLEIQAGGLIRMDRTREGTNVLDYFHTQYRAASFILGIVLGYFLFKIKEENFIIKLSKLQLWLGWVTAVVLALGAVFFVSVFQDPQYVYTPWLDTLYGILHRPALSLGIAWVIVVCTLDYGGLVNTVLSWNVMHSLSKLTYCAFLVHFFIQDVQAFSTRTAVTTDFLNLWYMFFADFFISYVLAAVLHLTIEAPANNLTEYLLKEKSDPADHRQSDSQLPSFSQKGHTSGEHSPHGEVVNVGRIMERV